MNLNLYYTESIASIDDKFFFHWPKVKLKRLYFPLFFFGSVYCI